ARKMFGLAFAAQPPVSRIHNLGRRAAVWTEAVPLMPVDERLCLRNDRGVFARDDLRGRARVTKIAESSERSRVRRAGGFRHVNREYRPIAIEAQKDAG